MGTRLLLENWTTEQKEALAEQVAGGLSVNAAALKVGERYQDELYPYKLNVLWRWCKSDDGREVIQKILLRIRKEAETRSFANSGSRINALVDVAEEIYNALKDLDKKKDTRNFVSLCGEFRQYMDILRKEMQPLEAIQDTALSLVERWEKLRRKAEKEELWDATSEN